MNILQVKSALPHLLRNNIVPFLWGSQGVGKTQTVAQYAAENGLELVVLHTATQEVGDLIGLLTRKDDGTVTHSKPEWFPTKGRGIVFLDELNRAPQDVIQAMFSFILNGTLHNHKLPADWRIVAAGNYASDRFTVTSTTDAAWLSRFCHIDFAPSAEEWTVYAENKGAFDVADFIKEQPSMLELNAKEGGRLDTSFIVPDRRAWLEGVGRLDSEGLLPEQLKYEVYSGLVGIGAASAFLSWANKREKCIKLRDVLSNYSKVRSDVKNCSVGAESRFDLLNGPIDELLIRLEASPQTLSASGALNNLKQFLLDVPRELSMKVFVGMGKLNNFYGKQELLNDPEYVRLFL